jgi:hypothetical protein
LSQPPLKRSLSITSGLECSTICLKNDRLIY